MDGLVLIDVRFKEDLCISLPPETSNLLSPQVNGNTLFCHGYGLCI